MRIRIFYNIVNSPYRDFQELTPEQASQAISNAYWNPIRSQAPQVDQIELYVDSPGRNTDWEPELGLVFNRGIYQGIGLGGTTWANRIEEKFRSFIGKHIQPELLTEYLT